MRTCPACRIQPLHLCNSKAILEHTSSSISTTHLKLKSGLIAAWLIFISIIAVSFFVVFWERILRTRFGSMAHFRAQRCLSNRRCLLAFLWWTEYCTWFLPKYEPGKCDYSTLTFARTHYRNKDARGRWGTHKLALFRFSFCTHNS